VEDSGRRQDIEPLIIGLGALLALALGYLGYREAQAGHSPTDALFAAVQLFVLEGGIVEGRTPWELDVARFLAPAALAYAAVRTILLFLRERVSRWRLRLFARDHMIIVGLTEAAFAIATGLAARGRRVAVVDAEGSGPRALACRERGIPVVRGHMTDPAVLDQARPRRAAAVVIASGDDSLNLRVLAACEAAVSDSGGEPAIHVEVSDLGLWSELHSLGLARPEHRTIEFFSPADREARALLEAADAKLVPEADSLSVVIDGADDVVARLLIHLSRRAAALGVALSASPAGPRAAEGFARAKATAPWLQEAEREAPQGARASSHTGFICGLEDAEALGAVSELGRPARAWVAVSDLALAQAMRSTQLDLPGVELVAARATALGPALLSESAIEVIARAKHEDYVAREAQRERTPAENTSMVPWSELREALRVSNVRFAQSIASKLGDLGAILRPLNERMPNDELVLPGEDLEELARAEHERWRRDLERDGWRATDGPKDPERRFHPLLVAWEDLDEAEREKDRDAIRALPFLLARAGYRISVPEEHYAP
jgi:voltage-gated potassium channel Kch